MSYIKIPRVSASAIPTPEAGKYIIFSNVDKSGNLFAKDQDGNAFDLTEATSGLFNPDNVSTEFKVNELNVTLTPAQLTSMSHNKFFNPTGGVELLPAPGEGKCYIIAMDGIFANYTSNSNWGYKASPIGENRTLDVYYPNEGTSNRSESNKIFSIPLFLYPYSDYTGYDRSYASDLLGATASLFVSQKQESLCIDTRADSVIYQQQNVNGSDTAFGTYSIVNQPLYIGTNGDLSKQIDSTNGEIKIKLWYSIIDVSDIYTTPSESNTLEDFFLSDKIIVRGGRESQYWNAINFLDNPLFEKPISFWEDFPRVDVGYDTEDYYTTYRANKDAFLKFTNESALAYNDQGIVGGYDPGGKIRFDKLEDLEFPISGAFGTAGGFIMRYSSFNGPASSQFGFPMDDINYEVISSRVPVEQGLDKFYYNRMPYDVDEGTRCRILDPNGAWTEGFIFDSSCGRVSEIEIVSGGTGYAKGESVILTGGTSISTMPGTGYQCSALAQISRVSSTGKIEKVTLDVRKSEPHILGGYFYTSAPTVTVSTDSGSGAVLTATISTGQWISREDYSRDTSFGDLNFQYEDIATTQRATKDFWFKAMYEYTRQNEDAVHALLDIPRFQIEKYQL